MRCNLKSKAPRAESKVKNDTIERQEYVLTVINLMCIKNKIQHWYQRPITLKTNDLTKYSSKPGNH